MVDLAGRLSNPREAVETLADQEWRDSGSHLRGSAGVSERPNLGHAAALAEQRGRLSNPVQRRLSETVIEQLLRDYVAGWSIDALAERLHVHRTTIVSHLDRRGIDRRRNARKMTDGSVRQAGARYASGDPLNVVALQFGVDAKSLAREFRRAGTEIRSRRGWPPRS